MSTSTHPCNPCQLVDSRGCSPFASLVVLEECFFPACLVGWFSGLSFTRTLEEMGTRIDDLEKNVVELMLQAGMKEQEISKQWLKLRGHSWTTGWTLTSKNWEGPLMFINKCQKILIKLKSDVYSNAANSLRSLKTLHCMHFCVYLLPRLLFFSLCSIYRDMMSCRWNWLFHEQTVN